MIDGRVVLKVEDDFFHLASYTLAIDGSLYLSLVREGYNDNALTWSNEDNDRSRIEFEEPRPKTKKISYHTTGLVRYHGMTPSKMFFEPLYAVSAPNHIVAYIIPSVEKLDKLDGIEDRDYVFEVASDGPTQFSFSVAPWQHVPEADHFAIRFHQLFALIVEVTSPSIQLPTELAQHVTTLIATSGLTALLLDEPTAFAQFHKQINQTQDLIIYSPNINGEYRIICSTPMRIPPRLEIQFFDKSFHAEQLPPHSKRGTVEVRFRVRGKGGYIKKEVPIASIALHAEL